jgi:predicted permease
MMTIWQDIRHGLRILMRQPGQSLMIAGILAVGIAGTTAVFSLFNGVFLRPLPLPDQKRVMHLDEIDPATGNEHGVPYYRYSAWRRYNESFETMAFSSQWVANISHGGRAEHVGMRNVTHEFFDLFGIRPILGRSFTAEEDRPGGPKVVLLSEGLWKRMFDGDPGILGRSVTVDDDPAYTVVGILPDATFPDRKDLWCPLRADPEKDDGGLGPMAAGRLRKGVTTGQARDDLTRIQKGWAEQHPDKRLTRLPNVIPMRELCLRVAGQFRFALFVTLGVVALVLVIACFNVASTMLARGTHQSRELAVRATLGATRGRIVQQVLAESLVLSVVGCVPGVLLGSYALQILLRLLGGLIPPWMEFPLDARWVLFCLAVVAATTVLSGLLPALHAAAPLRVGFRPAPIGMLQALGTRTTGSRAKRRTLDAIIAAQVALAMTLLVGAGLVLRTYLKIQNTDPGFRTAGILTYHVPLSVGSYLDENKRHAFWERHIERVGALPGVVHAALVNNVPMTVPAIRKFEIEGENSVSDEQSPPVLVRRVTPNYFQTLGIPLLAGRGFTEEDNRRESERTVVVEKTFAERFWPGESPIDKRIRQQGTEDWIRVIGVVGDVKHLSLDQSAQLGVYLPRVTDAAFAMWGVVQTSGDPLSLVPAIRSAVRSVDPGVPVEEIQTMSERVRESMSGRRLALWMYGIPALVAAILAFAGIYGVTSFAVSQRTQEIGIRMALGARVPDVVRMVVRQGLRVALVGLAVGSLGAILLGRVLASMGFMLYDVGPADPVTLACVPLLLTAVSTLASYLPARKAARVDPMTALRCE